MSTLRASPSLPLLRTLSTTLSMVALLASTGCLFSEEHVDVVAPPGPTNGDMSSGDADDMGQADATSDEEMGPASCGAGTPCGAGLVCEQGTCVAGCQMVGSAEECEVAGEICEADGRCEPLATRFRAQLVSERLFSTLQIALTNPDKFRVAVLLDLEDDHTFTMEVPREAGEPAIEGIWDLVELAEPLTGSYADYGVRLDIQTAPESFGELTGKDGAPILLRGYVPPTRDTFELLYDLQLERERKTHSINGKFSLGVPATASEDRLMGLWVFEDFAQDPVGRAGYLFGDGRLEFGTVNDAGLIESPRLTGSLWFVEISGLPFYVAELTGPDGVLPVAGRIEMRPPGPGDPGSGGIQIWAARLPSLAVWAGGEVFLRAHRR